MWRLSLPPIAPSANVPPSSETKSNDSKNSVFDTRQLLPCVTTLNQRLLILMSYRPAMARRFVRLVNGLLEWCFPPESGLTPPTEFVRHVQHLQVLALRDPEFLRWLLSFTAQKAESVWRQAPPLVLVLMCLTGGDL